jgi:sec-independent protein translocase protein TatA
MLAIGVPGPFELIVIALIVLLLFGKRLPGLMHSLGRSVVEFKKGVGDTDNLDNDDDNDRV